MKKDEAVQALTQDSRNIVENVKNGIAMVKNAYNVII